MSDGKAQDGGIVRLYRFRELAMKRLDAPPRDWTSLEGGGDVLAS